MKSKAVGCWGIKRGTCESKSVAPNLSVCITELSVPYADVSFKIGSDMPPVMSQLSSWADPQGRGVWHPASMVQSIKNGPFGAMQGAPCFLDQKHSIARKPMVELIEVRAEPQKNGTS
jgi:hypothetical protein